MSLCPVGHESAADDYCDACGRRMGGLAAASPAGGEPTRSAPAGGEPPQPSCPVCHTPRSGRFCEVCRFDFVTGAPTARVAVVVGRRLVADRAQRHRSPPIS